MSLNTPLWAPELRHSKLLLWTWCKTIISLHRPSSFQPSVMIRASPNTTSARLPLWSALMWEVSTSPTKQGLQKASIPPRSWPRDCLVLETCTLKARTVWQDPRSAERQDGKGKWSEVRADTKLAAFCSPHSCKRLWSWGEIRFASPQQTAECAFTSLPREDKGAEPSQPCSTPVLQYCQYAPE